MSRSSPQEQPFLDALQLNLIPGLGPRLQTALCEAFGSPGAVLNADVKELQQVEGIGPKLARSMLEGRDPSAAQREWRRCRNAGIELILKGTEAYPRLLSEICDPPLVLYGRGTREPRDEMAVAIVGSRRCTLYGRQQAEALAGALARAGVTIVSGLARGIDAAAHRGALQAGGRTIAVFATGMDRVYPPEHKDLAEQIVGQRQGAILSESPLDQQPTPGLFPQRNRIISGLSLGVIIVEASRRSGALHTARHAMEQGREVFAVPGRIDQNSSQGCHDLIRDGVTLIESADDVLDQLGPLVEPVQPAEGPSIHTPQELTLNDQEREVLQYISAEPTPVDHVLAGTLLESSRVLATLTVLEMKRVIRRLPGGYVVRAVR